jgi:hypothetical protein
MAGIFIELDDKAELLTTSVPIAATQALTAAGTRSTVHATEQGQVWSITAKGEDVYVDFGLNPTGATTNKRFIPNGQTRQFYASSNDEYVAYTAA